MKKAKAAEESNKKQERDKKKDERLAKQHETQLLRESDPKQMAEYFANNLMKDNALARDLVLKLMHDKHSSSLTTDLSKLADQLQDVILVLTAGSNDATVNFDDVRNTATTGQGLVDSMRPLFARGQSTLGALRKTNAPSVAGNA